MPVSFSIELWDTGNIIPLSLDNTKTKERLSISLGNDVQVQGTISILRYSIEKEANVKQYDESGINSNLKNRFIILDV
jgi:hypothetical protein